MFKVNKNTGTTSMTLEAARNMKFLRSFQNSYTFRKKPQGGVFENRYFYIFKNANKDKLKSKSKSVFEKKLVKVGGNHQEWVEVDGSLWEHGLTQATNKVSFMIFCTCNTNFKYILRDFYQCIFCACSPWLPF